MIPPERGGISISGGTISGNYDTADTWPLTVTVDEGITIDSVTVDGDAVIVTDNVIPVPYAGTELIIAATRITAKGEESVTYTYNLDVDYVPIRAISPAPVTVDQSTGEVSGVVSAQITWMDLYYNADRVTWVHRSRLSYRIKFSGSDIWGESTTISLNNGGSSIGLLVGYVYDVEVTYTYSGITSTRIFHVDMTISADIPYDATITPFSDTEGLTIDTSAHTITGTFAASDIIKLSAILGDTEIYRGSAYIFYANTWLRYYDTAHDYREIAAGVLSDATYLVPAVKMSSDSQNIFGDVYSVNITITPSGS